MIASLNIQTGGAALDLKTCPSKPYRWLQDMVWLNLVELSKLLQFTNIIFQVSWSSVDHTCESSIKVSCCYCLVTKMLLLTYFEVVKWKNWVRTCSQEILLVYHHVTCWVQAFLQKWQKCRDTPYKYLSKGVKWQVMWTQNGETKRQAEYKN